MTQRQELREFIESLTLDEMTARTKHTLIGAAGGTIAGGRIGMRLAGPAGAVVGMPVGGAVGAGLGQLYARSQTPQEREEDLQTNLKIAIQKGNKGRVSKFKHKLAQHYAKFPFLKEK